MAIARLSRVTLLSTRDELGALLASLMEFGQFHPSMRDGLVQDVNLLLLGSRAHAVYFEAGELLREDSLRVVGEENPTQKESNAYHIEGLVQILEDSIRRIRKKTPVASSETERITLRNELRAIQETARTIFGALERMRVYPGHHRIIVLDTP